MSTSKTFVDFFDSTIFTDAFKELKRNQKKTRFEHEYYQGYVTIDSFEKNLDENFCQIRQLLSDKSYRFSKLHPVLLPKEGKSSYRMICIPTVQDRIVQKILIRYLQQTDQLASSQSKDFSVSRIDLRKEDKGSSGARRLAIRLRKQYPYTLKTDISAFFDNIDRAKLMQKIRSEVSAVDIFYLLESAIRCDPKQINFLTPEKNAFIKSKLGKGVRQGMPISPILASFYLSDFDEEMKNKRIRVIRYADDLLFLSKSTQQSLRAFQVAKTALNREGLNLPSLEEGGKSQIYAPKETIRFLGLNMIFDNSNNSFSWHIPLDTIEEIKNELNDFTNIKKNLTQGIGFSTVLQKIDQSIMGYLGYFREEINKNQYENFELEMIDLKKKILLTLLKNMGFDTSNLSTDHLKFLLGFSKKESIEIQKKQFKKPNNGTPSV
jgi:RNA-directed DNA polymerase